MGCTASKLDNEDTVRRCKERRRLMKEAVQSRHHLAAAHSDYLRSLLFTGAALSRFASGEPLSVSEQTPPILLHHSSRRHLHHPSSISSSSSIPPSTPQPPHFPSPSPTISTHKPPPPPAVRRHPAVNSAYATTPSQASSAWDWENFYPPSPPDSDFFSRIKQDQEKEKHIQHQNQRHHLQEEDEEEDEDEEEEEEEGEGREEVQCSEWGEQHYSSSTTSSTKSSCAGDDDKYSRSDGFATRSDYAGSEFISRPAPSEIGSSVRKTGRGDRSDTGSSSVAGDLRMVLRHRSLAEIVAALEEYFVKAAGAGEEVSEILETGRAQLDRSFRQIRSKWE